MKYSSFSLALRHYLITNLLFAFGLILTLRAEFALADLAAVLLLVLMFSLPGLLVDWIILSQLKRTGVHPTTAWLCFLLSNLISVSACFGLLHLFFPVSIRLLTPFPLFAAGAALLASLFCLIPFNKFFLFNYENKHNKEDYQDYADLLHD